MWNEFKKFISRGDVVSLAIGLIIGSAFTAIVKSLVSDIINPVISLIMGDKNLNSYKWVLKASKENTTEISVKYGAFISAIINFFVIAVILFLLVKAYNKFMEELEQIYKKEETIKEETPKLTLDQELLTQIRDLLTKEGIK